MNSVSASKTKLSASLNSISKAYGIPQTLSKVEDEFCERVAASILDFRLKKERAILEEAQAAKEGNVAPTTSYPFTKMAHPLHRVNCDLENLGEDMTDPTEGSFSKGKHKILRVGYSSMSTRNWRNTTRIRKPEKPEKPEKRRMGRRHRTIPKVKLDAPIDDSPYAQVTSKGFTASKLPHRYKEIKSVMQPSLPTTGNDSSFAAIPKLVSYATEIWRQEEEEERRREDKMLEESRAGTVDKEKNGK